MKPPDNKDAPAAGKHSGARIETIVTNDHTKSDPLAAYPLSLDYALSAILWWPAARALAEKLGPSLFPAGAARSIGSVIVNGSPWNPTGVGARFRREAVAFIDALERTRIPASEDHARHLVRLLAEDRHVELLADTLLWAAGAVRQRMRLSWVLARVVEAFWIAEGERPLDPDEDWRDASGRAA